MLAYKSLILVSLLRVVAGSNVLSLNPVGCVDPNSFSSCVNTVENIGAQCIQQCQIGDVNCNGACGGAAVDGEIQCYIQYCWNKVYSCEYQYIFVSSGLAGNSGQAFFPAPKNPPGGCNCNLYDVSSSEQTWLNNWVGCANLVTGDPETYNSCQCCALGGLAAVYDACPGIDCSPLLSQVNIPGDISTFVSQNKLDLSTCNSQVLSNCSVFFNDVPAGGKYVNPASPINGDASMTNTGALTTFPAGPGTSTFNYAGNILTLVPYNGADVTQAPSVAVTGSGISVTSAVTASGAGLASSATAAAGSTSASLHSQASGSASGGKTTTAAPTGAAAGTTNTGAAAATTSKSGASHLKLMHANILASIVVVLSVLSVSF